MLLHLEAVPPDPLLHIADVFAADSVASKLDLGIGVYRDESGATPVMQAVHAAEEQLLIQQQTKTYLTPAGRQEFNRAMAAMVLGSAHPALSQGLVGAVQTPGGCGALRLAIELVRIAGARQVAVGSPTWANHVPVIAATGLEPCQFPYFDARTANVTFEPMMEAITRLPAGTPLLIQGCGHNPSGAVLTRQQEDIFINCIATLGHFPIIDLAYHGLCDGLEQDLEFTRRCVQALPETLIAVSCSKNFAMYCERVGALLLTAQTPRAVSSSMSNVLRIARVMHSMPPDHGAAIVARIWNCDDLRASWLHELDDMRARIGRLRSRLASAFDEHGLAGLGRAIGLQRGMFSLLPLCSEDVLKLRQEHHIYVSHDGRINIAGIPESRVGELAAVLATSTRLAQTACDRPGENLGRR